MTEEQLSEEDKQLVKEYLDDKSKGNISYNAPLPEEKHNVHMFLHSVATAEDTTKVGNLTSEEVGTPRLTLRANKELHLIASEIMNNDIIANYYKKQGEILTSTSLSKDAKLINLVVLQKRQIEDVTKRKKENSGWFKKKDKEQSNEQTS